MIRTEILRQLHKISAKFEFGAISPVLTAVETDDIFSKLKFVSDSFWKYAHRADAIYIVFLLIYDKLFTN